MHTVLESPNLSAGKPTGMSAGHPGNQGPAHLAVDSNRDAIYTSG